MRLTPLLLAATLVATSSPAVADPISALFVFGDSLSDNGNLSAALGGVVPADPYAIGRASNGPVAVELLAAALGLAPLVPAALGGTNYAVIGAATAPVPLPTGGTADNLAGVLGVPLPTPTGMLNAQVPLFASRLSGPIDPDALFFVWGGPNDLFIDPAPGVALAAANNIAAVVDQLFGLGARRFLVPSMADLGLTPGADAYAAVYSGLTSLFNGQLAQNLAALDARPGITIDRFDTFGLFQTIAGNPALYGFSNVEDECYVGPLLGFGPGDRSVCASPDAYLFWDQSHPTTRANEWLAAGFADAVQEAPVPEPVTMVLAGVGIAAVGLRRRLAA